MGSASFTDSATGLVHAKICVSGTYPTIKVHGLYVALCANSNDFSIPYKANSRPDTPYRARYKAHLGLDN